jgi:aspartate aminotransferase
MQISNRIASMEPSATLEMAKKSRELKEKGIDIISLSLGEPDFNTPDYINNAAKQAIDNNITKYPPVNGFLELRQAICSKLKRDNNLTYSPSQIVVSTGAKQSLANIFLSVLNEGDEVIVFAPYWVSYIEQIKLAGGVPVILNSDITSDYKINSKELEEAINDKTKLIIYSSPCNPSGSVYTKEELHEVAKITSKHPNITIISDEIYELINFDDKHESIAQFDFIKEQIVIVNGVSKGFSMTGWRLGYIAAPQWLADACTKIQGQITSGASSISQKAAEKAVNESPEKVKYMLDEFKKRKETFVTGLNEIKGLKCNNPKGAFYVYPDISYFFGKSYEGKIIKNATDLSLFILDKGRVSVVTGEAFGSKNNIRLSYAVNEEVLTEAIKRIKSALSLLS